MEKEPIKKLSDFEPVVPSKPEGEVKFETPSKQDEPEKPAEKPEQDTADGDEHVTIAKKPIKRSKKSDDEPKE